MSEETTLKTRKDELQQELTKINEALNVIENIASRKKAEKLNGKCFVYKNGWSGNEKWNLYVHIIGILERDYVIQTIEETPLGIEMKHERKGFYSDHLFEKEIPVKTYMAKTDKLLSKMGLKR